MAQAIVIEEEFTASAEALWRAITDRDQMVQWYFAEISAFAAEVGFKAEFSVDVEARRIIHQWEVTDVVPRRKLSHTWRFESIPGDGMVTWEVFERGPGSTLRLTNTGLETFPADDPLFTREACEGGWHYFIGERLKAFLDGHSA